MPATIRREHRLGEPLYYVDDHSIRQGNMLGPVLYHWDGRSVRRHHSLGEQLFTIDGSRILQGGSLGTEVAWYDGDELRPNRLSPPSFHFDGDSIRRGDRFGPQLLQSDNPIPAWAVVALTLDALDQTMPPETP